MHATDVLKYGHTFITRALDGLDESHYETGGVCGVWSVKDIIGHLASQEGLLVEILQSSLEIDAPKSFMATMMQYGPLGFNDIEAEKRKDKSFVEVWEEYVAFVEESAKLIEQIPLETQRLTGLLEWYGSEYDLEDFIVYTYYGHKREHGAQINLHKDRVKSDS